MKGAFDRNEEAKLRTCVRSLNGGSEQACTSVSAKSFQYEPLRAVQLTTFGGMGLSSFRAYLLRFAARQCPTD